MQIYIKNFINPLKKENYLFILLKYLVNRLFLILNAIFLKIAIIHVKDVLLKDKY